MIYQYEIDFSVKYHEKITDSQSAIIPAYSLEDAKGKLTAEVKRRLGDCEILMHSASLHVSEHAEYSMIPKKTHL